MSDLKAVDGSTMSVHEAAVVLGTTVPRLLMMMRSGTLKGKCVDGVWQVNRASLGTCPAPHALPHVKGGCGGCHSCAS